MIETLVMCGVVYPVLLVGGFTVYWLLLQAMFDGGGWTPPKGWQPPKPPEEVPAPAPMSNWWWLLKTYALVLGSFFLVGIGAMLWTGALTLANYLFGLGL